MSTYIEISGWRYEPWRGIFYPKGLRQEDELHFASRQFNSIEINGTFYSSQSPQSFQKWYASAPDNFVFSVKGPRYITHIRRLKTIEIPLANFFATGVLHLKEKLGPFLWQFPPSFLFYEDRLETFFKLLPRTVADAVKFSKKADRREPSFPSESENLHTKLQHAIEVRNHSFENPYFIELLRQHNIALVFADTAGKWPYMEDITSDFLYLRLHGDEKLYESGYTDRALKQWGRRVNYWARGGEPPDALTLSDQKPQARKRNCYVYFDNDVKVRAPFDAKKLRKLVKDT